MLKSKKVLKVMSFVLAFTLLFNTNVFAYAFFPQTEVGNGAYVNGSVEVSRAGTAPANTRYVNASTTFMGSKPYNNTTAYVELYVVDASTSRVLYKDNKKEIWTTGINGGLVQPSLYTGNLIVSNIDKGAIAVSTHGLSGPISFFQTLTETR